MGIYESQIYNWKASFNIIQQAINPNNIFWRIKRLYSDRLQNSEGDKKHKASLEMKPSWWISTLVGEGVGGWGCNDYRPHPKDREGNVFSLFTNGGGGGVPQSQDLSLVSGPRSLSDRGYPSPGWGVTPRQGYSCPGTGGSPPARTGVPPWDWGNPQDWD